MGMTLKQSGRARFKDALDEYQAALKSRDMGRIICASLNVHRAKGLPGVTKAMAAKVGRVFKESR